MNLHQYYMKHYTKKSVALSTFRLNVKRGMTLEEAMVTRRRELKKAYAKGDSEYMRFLEIAKQNNISTNVFYHRVQMGWPLERAATQPKRIRRDKPKLTDAYIPTKNDKVMIKEIRLLINAGVPIGKKRYVDYIKKHPELFPELGVKSREQATTYTRKHRRKQIRHQLNRKHTRNAKHIISHLSLQDSPQHSITCSSENGGKNDDVRYK